MQLGISLAEYIRRLVAQDLCGPRGELDPSSVFDLGNSGGCDVARDKDAMLRAAIEKERATEASSRESLR